MKIAICDDNAQCRQQVQTLLSEYAGDKDITISAYDRGAQLLEDTRRIGGFDIYILDVIMPGLTGIQLGLQLRQSDFSGKILYLTSSQEYAVDAFRTQASGYLLKPVTREALFAGLDNLVSAIAAKREKSHIIKTRESSLRVSFDSILYVELVKKNVVYHLVGGRTVESTSIRSTFSEAIQDLLLDHRFTLCGNARAVNLHYVTELDAEALIFRNGCRVHVGRRAIRDIRSVWFDFWFHGEEHL